MSREPIVLPDLADDEALVEPLFGSWEANLGHAVSRQPIDICHTRGEPSVIIGNLGVVRVLRPPRTPSQLCEGDLCLIMPFARRDRYGYAELVYAYDGPGTYGILATRTKLAADLLLPIPAGTNYSLPQWAAYARFFTAWDNWRVAYACWRSQMEEQDPAQALVFGWGGGVVFAELQLAQRAGFRVAMTASSDKRLSYLAEHAITGIDRRDFTDLELASGGELTDPQAAVRGKAAQQRLLNTIADLSDGAGVAIFLDNIGAPLYRTTLKALARQAVLSSVGWKQGMRVYNLRAAECIKRHLHVNTHVWRYQDSPAIRDYQEANGWMPAIDVAAVYDFDSVPQLAADYNSGRVTSYFPLFQVNEV